VNRRGTLVIALQTAGMLSRRSEQDEETTATLKVEVRPVGAEMFSDGGARRCRVRL